MLRYRLIFGVLMAAGLWGMFWLDARLDQVTLSGGWQHMFLGRHALPAGLLLLALTVLLVIPLSCRELARIFGSSGIQTHWVVITFAAEVTCVTVYSTPMALNAVKGITIIASVLVGSFVGTLLWHSRDAHVKGAVASAGATMFAVVLLGLMPAFYLAMRREYAAWVVLGVLLITKSCDIGAYFTGRFLGRHKMCPWLSPKKTWEGLAGGVIFAACVTGFFAWLSQTTEVTTMLRSVGQTRITTQLSVPIIWGFGCGAILALVGQLGDLMVSLFKRDAGLKDSGASIPGFGGILDVVDSPLLVAPVAYWLLLWVSSSQ